MFFFSQIQFIQLKPIVQKPSKITCPNTTYVLLIRYHLLTGKSSYMYESCSCHVRCIQQQQQQQIYLP